MNILYIFIAVVIAIAILYKFGVFKEVTKETLSSFPYQKKSYLLSIAERKFFDVLYPIAQKNNWHLFVKVRLEDLLLTSGDWKSRSIARNRIKSRHIDFLICDKENIKPILAVELDDSSHQWKSRVARDDFVNRVLHNIALSIVHIPVRSLYNPQEIESEILRLME